MVARPLSARDESGSWKANCPPATATVASLEWWLEGGVGRERMVG